MAGYIGSKASVVSSGAERKKTFAITTSTTSLTGLSYTVDQVHVFHNGVRLVDGTDYTATNGTSITLTSAAESGDEVVVVSYATFQTSDTVSASTGGTFAGDVTFDGSFTSQGIDDNATSTAMTLDGSGNLLVGTTSTNIVASSTATDEGFVYVNGAALTAARSAGQVADFNRITNDGEIIRLRKDGTAVGRISTYGDGVVFGNAFSSAYANLRYTNDEVYPCTTTGGTNDNAIDLGKSNARYDDIYATNGNIQTSDRNEKQDVAALTATEMLVAARISGLFKTFRWIDSVADKGANARTHTGVIAQDVQAAFTAEGLDAGDYALFTSATWWETQTDVPAVEADEDNEIEAADAYTRTDTFDTLDEAPAGATERTRMGIRYPELLAFVGAYNEQRFASIETRLAALEAV